MLLDTTNEKLLLAYKGPFCIDILSTFGNYIRQIFNLQKSTATRLYKVFFELTQNVSKYSVISKQISYCKYAGIGSFSLKENDGQIVLSTSNLILSKDGPVLERYCSEINAMNKDKLRKYRSETRKLAPDSKDTGAHIGIIQIGLLSMNKLDFDVVAHNDKLSVFTICAYITK
jgi:hypothetical protein